MKSIKQYLFSSLGVMILVFLALNLKAVPTQTFISNRCDSLLLNDGSKQLIKVVSLGKGVLKYKDCRRASSSILAMRTSKIISLKNALGEPYSIEQSLSNSDVISSVKEQRKQKIKKVLKIVLITYLIGLILSIIIGFVWVFLFLTIWI